MADAESSRAATQPEAKPSFADMLQNARMSFNRNLQASCGHLARSCVEHATMCNDMHWLNLACGKLCITSYQVYHSAALQPFTVSVQQAFNTPTDAELSHHDSSDSESMDVRRGFLALDLSTCPIGSWLAKTHPDAQQQHPRMPFRFCNALLRQA